MKNDRQPGKSDRRPSTLQISASPLRSMLETVSGLAPSDRAREMLLERAHRVMDRFDRVGETMQKVADVQLEVMERLRPIVDDLGELVKLSLIDARKRLDSGDRATEVTIQHPPIVDQD